MNQELKRPALIAIIVALVAAVGFAIFRVGFATEEIKVPVKKSPGYIEGIPDYVKQGRMPREGEVPAGAGGSEKAPATPGG